MQRKRLVFPFSAVVGLDKLKLAILINAINPRIGGLLIRGPKGSGKSTIVRALADILPKIKVVKDCPFCCNPTDLSNMCPKCSERYKKGEKLPAEEREMVVVDLPLGATEDRVVGSLDVEKAIKHGIEALEPGILAETNQNILYVDEVNLLPDHIADDLLDAAATGWNVVEREGISVSHPSRFVFIGTMNPEEGELRPQLLDRFPLSVGVERIFSVKNRMEIVKRNIEFERNPEEFCEKHRETQQELRNRVIRAGKILPNVKMPEKLLEAVCKTCIDLKVDGMRPDIVISKAACTLAAFEDRAVVTTEDVLVASELALSHRTREGGFLEPATSEEIKKILMASIKEVKYIPEETIQKVKEKKEKAGGLESGGKNWGVKAVLKEVGEAGEEEQSVFEKLHNFFLYRHLNQLFFMLNRYIFGFTKRLKRGIKGAPIVDSVVKGRSKAEGYRGGKMPPGKEPQQVSFTKQHEESPEKPSFGIAKIPEEKMKGIPTVRSAIKPSDMAVGVSLFTKIKEGALAPFKLFFKIKEPYRKMSISAGKRADMKTALHRGRPCGWRFPHGRPRDIHLPATIREAARKQKTREKPSEVAITIHPDDVREKSRLYKAPLTMVFVIDLSGSMLFNIDSVKEGLLRLHRDAYRCRDRVGIVALKDTGAVVVQHPVTNLRVVANKLLNLRISGFTPLAAGMRKAWEVLKEARRRDPSTVPVMVIVTDGSANVPLKRSLETGEVRKIDEMQIIVREYEEVAARDVMSISKAIKREGIHTIVVNTNPHMYGRETYGLSVTKNISSITKGSHHAIGRLTTEKELIENMIARIGEDQRTIASQQTSMQRFN
jgi:Mg-chelatase subunit ChlI/Mg-chelatase subunit ChlD